MNCSSKSCITNLVSLPVILITSTLLKAPSMSRKAARVYSFLARDLSVVHVKLIMTSSTDFPFLYALDKRFLSRVCCRFMFIKLSRSLIRTIRDYNLKVW